MVVPDVRGPLHIAVWGGDGPFFLYADSAPYSLGEIRASPEKVEVAGSMPEGFLAWYTMPAAVSPTEDAFSKASFGVQVAPSRPPPPPPCLPLMKLLGFVKFPGEAQDDAKYHSCWTCACCQAMAKGDAVRLQARKITLEEAENSPSEWASHSPDVTAWSMSTWSESLGHGFASRDGPTSAALYLIGTLPWDACAFFLLLLSLPCLDGSAPTTWGHGSLLC